MQRSIVCHHCTLCTLSLPPSLSLSPICMIYVYVLYGPTECAINGTVSPRGGHYRQYLMAVSIMGEPGRGQAERTPRLTSSRQYLLDTDTFAEAEDAIPVHEHGTVELRRGWTADARSLELWQTGSGSLALAARPDKRRQDRPARMLDRRR